MNKVKRNLSALTRGRQLKMVYGFLKYDFDFYERERNRFNKHFQLWKPEIEAGWTDLGKYRVSLFVIKKFLKEGELK
jgi:hypothetical protein